MRITEILQSWVTMLKVRAQLMKWSLAIHMSFITFHFFMDLAMDTDQLKGSSAIS